MKKRQFGVIGLGNFGFSLAKTLSEKGCEVLCIDQDMDKVQEIKDIVINSIQADATDEKVLKSTGMAEVDVAIISLGQNMEASILTAMILQDLGVKDIVVKVVSDMHAKVLKKLGISRVVFPEKDMGKRIAESLIAPRIIEHLELTENFGIEEVIPPDDFINKNIKDLQIRSKYGVTVLAIKRQTQSGKEELLVNPTGDDQINSGDVLIVIGHEDNLHKLR